MSERLSLHGEAIKIIRDKIASDPWWNGNDVPSSVAAIETILFEQQERYNASLQQTRKLMSHVFESALALPDQVINQPGVFLNRQTFHKRSGITVPKIELIVREDGLSVFDELDTRGVSNVFFRTWPDSPIHTREEAASLRFVSIGWKDILYCYDEDVQNLTSAYAFRELNSASVSYVFGKGEDARKYAQLTTMVPIGENGFRAIQQLDAESGLGLKDWEMLSKVFRGLNRALESGEVLR